MNSRKFWNLSTKSPVYVVDARNAHLSEKGVPGLNSGVFAIRGGRALLHNLVRRWN